MPFNLERATDQLLRMLSIDARVTPDESKRAEEEIERRRLIAEADLSPDEKIANLEKRVFDLERRVSDLANRTPLL